MVAGDGSILLPPGVLESMDAVPGGTVCVFCQIRQPVRAENRYAASFLSEERLWKAECMETEEARIRLPHALLEEAGIPLDAKLVIRTLEGAVLIGEKDPLPVISGPFYGMLRLLDIDVYKRQMQEYGKSGLAETLSNRILSGKIASMFPDVEEHQGRLWGVVKVCTIGELTDREMAGLKEEWKEIAAHGWGEQFSCHTLKEGNVGFHAGFWDTDRGEDLCLMTEEEFEKEVRGFELTM